MDDEIDAIDEWMYRELTRHPERYARQDAEGDTSYDAAALAAGWMAAFPKWLENKADRVISDAYESGALP
jgi:hypothetical protein